MEKHTIIHTGEKPFTYQHHHAQRAALCAPCQQEDRAIKNERAEFLRIRNISAQKDAEGPEKSQGCTRGKILRALLQVRTGTRVVLRKARELLWKVPYGQHQEEAPPAGEENKEPKLHHKQHHAPGI